MCGFRGAQPPRDRVVSMIRTDTFFCRNMAFASDAVRRDAHELIEQHCMEVGQVFRDAGRSGVLCLSGSLARGEPAVAVGTNGRARLRSDLDWVVVADGLAPGVDRQLETRLNNQFPDFRDTVYCLPLERLPVLRSASVRDLRLGMAHPIVSNETDGWRPGAFPLDPAHGLEVIVYQIVAALGSSCRDASRTSSSARPTGLERMWSSEQERHPVKLAAESVRMATIGITSDAQTATYAFAVAQTKCGGLDMLAARCDLLRLLRAREVVNQSDALVTVDTASIVSRALSLLFSTPLRSTGSLLRWLRDSLLDSSHILHAFPRLAMCAYFAAEERLTVREASSIIGCRFPSIEALRSRVRSTCWAYLQALLQAKDRGIQLNAVA